jgi:hypothetical protein
MSVYFFLELLADWYEYAHIQSDEDISNLFLVFLGVLGVSIVMGGWLEIVYTKTNKTLWQMLTRPNDVLRSRAR